MKATLTFKNPTQAREFTKAWGRETLTGNITGSSKPDGTVDVTVYDVNDERKAFIDNYIKGVK